MRAVGKVRGQASMKDMERYITPIELERRWRERVNVRTLANWRSSGQGPEFVKIGGRVLYCIENVEEWEARRTRGVK